MSNPLKKRFLNALTTLVDDYGLTTTEVNRRTGIDLGVIRRARAGRPASVTIEDVNAASALIEELKKPAAKAQTTEQRIKALEEKLLRLEESGKNAPAELGMTQEALMKIVQKQEEVIKELEKQIQVLIKGDTINVSPKKKKNGKNEAVS